MEDKSVRTPWTDQEADEHQREWYRDANRLAFEVFENTFADGGAVCVFALFQKKDKTPEAVFTHYANHDEEEVLARLEAIVEAIQEDRVNWTRLPEQSEVFQLVTLKKSRSKRKATG